MNSKSYNIQKSWTINDVPRLTIFLASSWGHVNRLGRSYVTQSSPFWLAGWKSWEVETWKSATLPPPPHPSYSVAVVTAVSLHFSDSTSPGPAECPIGWWGPHTANQNGGDLYPYDDETGQESHMWLTISDKFFLFKVLYKKYTLYEEHIKIKT